jgi:hypothetical protein
MGLGQWPPKGLEVIDAWGFPLLNTLILLCSGTTVTWAHHGLIHGDRGGDRDGRRLKNAEGPVGDDHARPAVLGDPGL